MRTRKSFVFRARVDEIHQQKIDAMQQATGFTTSQLLRALVENAEVQPTIKTMPTKANSDTGILADSRIAVRA